MVLRVSPVSTLTAVTLTPATTAPVGSVTVPRIVAVAPVCASSEVTAKAASKVSLTIFGKYTPANAPAKSNAHLSSRYPRIIDSIDEPDLRKLISDTVEQLIAAHY